MGSVIDLEAQQVASPRVGTLLPAFSLLSVS